MLLPAPFLLVPELLHAFFCGSPAHLFFIKKKISMKAKLSLNGLRRCLADASGKPIPASAVILLSQMEEEMEMKWNFLPVSREKSREVCLELVLGTTRLPELMNEEWGWKTASARLCPPC